MLRRDLRAGELGLLLVALIIAVTSLTSVGFFTDRVARALKLEANQLLGGDIVLVADHALKPEWRAEATRRGLRSVESASFTSMATSARAQLAGVKVVEDGHPLRGSIRIAPGLNQPDAPAPGIPARGELWLDERLASALGAKVGDVVGLGASRLRMAAVLSFESDRGANFFSLLPRLIINAADLPATQLIQPGSRAFYRLHVAGDPAEVAASKPGPRPPAARREPRDRRQRPPRGAHRARPGRALPALCGDAGGGAGGGGGGAGDPALRRAPPGRLRGDALPGARQAQLMRLFIGEFVLLGWPGWSAAPWARVQFVLAGLLGGLVGLPLPAPGWWPVAHGLAVSLLLLLGFALPPLIRLGRVSTCACCAGSGTAWPRGKAWPGGWGAGAGRAAGGDRPRLAARGLGGGRLCAGLRGVWLVAWLVLGLLGHLRAVAGSGWRYGLAALRRRPVASLVQVLALGMGLTALLLLTLVRSDLLDNWPATPADAPNRFVINIQPDQLEPLRRSLPTTGALRRCCSR
jgi:putative ABC transport system permease protein